jgi:uncharacterized UPF0160 family protein
MSQKISRSLGTHDGTFHADEVTATALLLFFNCIDKEKIVRSRDPNVLKNCEYVCDVGGVFNPLQKLFDHHQVEYQGPLSSAGMILEYLKEQKKISIKEYDHLNETLILGVDAHDNGKETNALGTCTYSHIISNFNPICHEENPDVIEKCFFEALNFSLQLLQKIWQRYQYIQSCRQIVADTMKNGEECLIFDQNIPWLDTFFELDGQNHPAQFVIMPSENHWKLRGIPPDMSHKMQVRCPLPKEWAGLHDEELEKASGIKGSIFCHKGRFISVWETKEAALKALKTILQKKG